MRDTSVMVLEAACRVSPNHFRLEARQTGGAAPLRNPTS